MRVFSAVLSAASLILFTSSSLAASLHPHHRGTTHSLVRRSAATHTSRHVEQHSYDRASITPERATEIQSALIKQGYLAGDPTGSWDSASISAMQKLQSDNGWQTKLVPDSRALIKLGLGPGSEPVSAASATAAVTAATPSVITAETAVN